MLEIKALTASYDGIHALRGLDLRVGDGDLVALIGPNGAGKTTLMNTISGLIRPDQGEISFDGADIRRVSPHRIARAGLIHVPEGRQILSEMSVAENLDLGILAAGDRRAGPAAAARQRDLVFDLFPILAERRWQIAGSLSGGQQQMLAIGRALMGFPRLLMLDEPSLGLAPMLVSQVFEALGRLNASGLGILVVEQNARRALDLGRYAYVLERGRVVLHGTSEDIARNPTVVESYLGTLAATAS
ncbi:ABC transporter ATP-binding protein [Zavarzinia compransoris]|uniref:ABC transporter ATP-binding protein n=1 Tax=Zavarzinia compransoris TaxID=1264899 RepID=A0A317E3G6_9PROT|nr:ABC transporter ATP-binding protein [Zavarzinia compransoris]PWR21648.1 ABC transporter ATP-binding protein [Zavarzinia compransoris]TDP45571.1 amino acid/amide ABC transporter ATP-binding protein 2 (HAAT family) [Zavarzinia compransoris]